ncbi:MAG: periplasmic heavy metal sensor [Paracoccaceae bacterium]
MRSPWRTAFTILAVLSLFANAVVLGLWLRGSEMREVLNGGGEGFAGLPRDIRAEVRRSLQAGRSDLTAPLARLGAARRAMLDAAAARPYDAAAVEVRLAEVRAATAEVQESAHAILLGAFSRAAGK